MRQRAARGSCVLRVGLPRGGSGSGHTAVRTLNRGTLRCLRPFERPVTRRARGTRGPRADARREDRPSARRTQCAIRNTAFHGFDMVRRATPADGPRRTPETVSGVPSTPLMRGALSLISRPYLRGEPFTMPARRSLQSRRRVCSHVTWSLDPPHSQWIESPPNLAFTRTQRMGKLTTHVLDTAHGRPALQSGGPLRAGRRIAPRDQDRADQ